MWELLFIGAIMMVAGGGYTLGFKQGLANGRLIAANEARIREIEAGNA